MVDLKVNLSGITLDNPVIPASGTFGYGKEFAEIYDAPQNVEAVFKWELLCNCSGSFGLHSSCETVYGSDVSGDGFQCGMRYEIAIFMATVCNHLCRSVVGISGNQSVAGGQIE